MKTRKLLMILNPRAGKNKSRGPLFDAAAALSLAGWLLSIHVTSAPGDAAETARREGGRYDLVVAVGGDGTLNEVVSGLVQLRRPPMLGYLPQDFGYYPDFTAMKFLLYMSAIKGLSKGYARQRSLELLYEVGLLQVRDKKIKTFSGGMKRRVGIGQALLNDPAFLVLDEPTSGLDPLIQREFFAILKEYHAAGTTVFLSSHVLSEIRRNCSEALVLREGRAVARLGREELNKSEEEFEDFFLQYYMEGGGEL